jgi:hypothetical protein
MTSEHLAELQEWRRAGLRFIVREPHRYKQCEQCLSLVRKGDGVCCWCGAYRWVENPQHVKAIARLMRRSPYPKGAPVVPRIPPRRRSAGLTAGIRVLTIKGSIDEKAH